MWTLTQSFHWLGLGFGSGDVSLALGRIGETVDDRKGGEGGPAGRTLVCLENGGLQDSSFFILALFC